MGLTKFPYDDRHVALDLFDKGIKALGKVGRMTMGVFGMSTGTSREAESSPNPLAPSDDPGTVKPPSQRDPTHPPDPDDGESPYRCEIVRSERVGRLLIVELQYEHATNYGGHKILVYDDVDKFEFHLLPSSVQRGDELSIDPHFIEPDEVYSPMARFEPTDRGWRMAYKLCKSLQPT